MVILGTTAMPQTPSLAQKQLNPQTSFGLDSPMTRIVRVPPAVLHQLADHHDVREFLDGRSGSAAEVPGAFEAGPAHINTDGAEDLVVRNSRLNGANIGPFWLFTRTAQGYELVFFARSLGISILKPVASGYHDLKASSATAVALSETRYRFDGRAYQPKECSLTDLSTNRMKRVPCGGTMNGAEGTLREARYSVSWDTDQLFCTSPTGVRSSVRWLDLRSVRIRTTDSGPFLADVFWILEDTTSQCVVPQGADGESALLARLQQLPNFNSAAVIDAAASVENAEFICWHHSSRQTSTPPGPE